VGYNTYDLGFSQCISRFFHFYKKLLMQHNSVYKYNTYFCSIIALTIKLKSKKMISTKDIMFSYDSNQYFEFPNIECANGQTLLITGNSGTGKTTFLHLLGGLLKPESGQILINEQEVHQLKGPKQDVFRGSTI